MKRLQVVILLVQFVAVLFPLFLTLSPSQRTVPSSDLMVSADGLKDFVRFLIP